MMTGSHNIKNGVPATDKGWMGTPVHGKDGERLETMLAGQKILVLEHRAHIHGMGQSMLESQEYHIAWRTQRQAQDYETMTEDRGTCLDESTQH